ncbi:atherin [Passer montanus]|uniref:atherin n=1 Tax=Passer montanus TaxID=9160 RepID=UPI0019603BE5|nr:atherin [Passer montanus]
MGGVTFHPPRLPRELAVRYVLIHRREQDRGTRTELLGPGSGGFPERWRSCGCPGAAAAAAAAAWRAAPPAPHSHPRRYSQSERGVLRAAACGCAPPPPRRAPPAPRRPSPSPARMPGALPAPSPARPQLERGGARAACAAGYVWKLERQIAPSASSPAAPPAPRRGTAARARMHSRRGGVIPVTE